MPRRIRRIMREVKEVDIDCKEATIPQDSTRMVMYIWAGISFHKIDIHSKRIEER